MLKFVLLVERDVFLNDHVCNSAFGEGFGGFLHFGTNIKTQVPGNQKHF